MKLTIVLLTAAILTANASGVAQSISLDGRKLTYKQVFSEIEKQTGYVVFGNKELVESGKTVSLKVKNVALETFLEDLLVNQPFKYEIENRTVFISRKQAADAPPLLEKFIAVPLLMNVKGRVLDSLGSPVAGASIRIKGSRKAMATNNSGEFSFSDVDENAVLQITCIGYESQDVELRGRTSIAVTLKAAVKSFTEIVVTTGLYKRPTENFTGVATTVSGDQLRAVNSMNVFDALKVFDPAVRIQDNMQFGSDPNRLPNISLRGTNNFPVQGSTDIPASGADFMAAYQSNPSMPLFILDGFEVSLQKIYDLDINRIEKMTILKDAVATSAYGSRAANGVIVVETRQPKPGKLTVNYSATIQYTGPDLTSYHLLNAADKLQLEKAGGIYYGGTNPDFQNFYDQLYSKRKADVERGVNTYWLAKPLQNGWGNKHSVFVEGGDRYLRYSASFGYTNNRGVMKGSSRNNYEGGMMLSYRRNQLMIRNQLTVTGNRSDNSPYGAFSAYTRLNPYWSPYDASGKVRKVLDIFSTPGYAGQTIITNPLYNATLGTTDYSKYFGFNNNTFIEYRFNNGLHATGKLGISNQTDQSHQFFPADHTNFASITDYNSTDYFTRGSYQKGEGSFFSYDVSLTLDYNKTIGKSLFFATLGATAAEQNSRSGSFTVRGFPNARLDEFFFGKEYLRDSRPAGNNNVTRRTSLFTSLNYTYDKRYLVDFSWNMDGSTQFGAENRFAPFWAVGVGWNIHEEAFMASLKSTIISRLKLRAGVGTTGSQQFSPYMAVSTYQYNSGQDYTGMFGATLLSYGNNALKWQQTLKYNAGADISLFSDRIAIRLESYREITNDLLLDINTPPSLGVSSYKENVGKLENIGMEANINAFVIRNDKKSIFLSVFVNGIHNKNRIREISNSLTKTNQKNDGTDNNLQVRPQLRFVEGQSVNAIWAVRSAGIDPSSGREAYYTKDGDLTYTWRASDKVIVGDAIPDLSGNFGSSFSYKGIQLSVYMSYQLGGTLYNQTLADRVENADIRFNVDERVLLGRWKKPGDETYFKGLVDINGATVTTMSNATSRFLQKNDFVDIGSLSLGYIIPDSKTAKLNLKNTRISFQVNNLARLSTIQVERGLDYPFARNFTLNFNTSF